jgi:hypothetical protein
VRNPRGGDWHSVSIENYISLQPRQHRSAYSRCEVAIFVAKDFSHVLMGGGEFGYDGIVNELDGVAVEALAERYPFPELKKAAEVLSK